MAAHSSLLRRAAAAAGCLLLALASAQAGRTLLAEVPMEQTDSVFFPTNGVITVTVSAWNLAPRAVNAPDYGQQPPSL